jgi:hypothetical protein
MLAGHKFQISISRKGKFMKTLKHEEVHRAEYRDLSHSRSSHADRIERRSRERYPIRLRVRYRTRDPMRRVVGIGLTVNVSCGGILVETLYQRKVSVGSRLEVNVEWPVLLNGTTPLKLVVLGRVVRTEMFGFVVSLDRHDLRTMKRGDTGACDLARQVQ